MQITQFIPTKEHRKAKQGEWYQSNRGIIQHDCKHPTIDIYDIYIQRKIEVPDGATGFNHVWKIPHSEFQRGSDFIDLHPRHRNRGIAMTLTDYLKSRHPNIDPMTGQIFVHLVTEIWNAAREGMVPADKAIDLLISNAGYCPREAGLDVGFGCAGMDCREDNIECWEKYLKREGL